MVLLHALVRTGYKRLLVCHLDHGIRGHEARADAKFVVRTASALGLESVIGRADVPRLAVAGKLSLETAAREARKAFFFEIARRRRCHTIFLAHHADDQVETVLFNLCRGTGATGLGGMQFAGEWRAPSLPRKAPVTLQVIRPFLGVWRREIDEYAALHGIRHREDATNADPAHTRNRLRHEVIPLLNDVFGRDTTRNVWRAAEITGQEDTLLREQIATNHAALATVADLPCKSLLALSVAEQRRVLHSWLRARGCQGIGYEEIERTRTLLDIENGPAKINLPGNRHVRRRAGTLFVESAEAA